MSEKITIIGAGGKMGKWICNYLSKKKIDVEKKRAIKEIKEEVVDLSLDLASQVLQRNVKDEDNNKFVQSSLKEINTDEAKS